MSYKALRVSSLVALVFCPYRSGCLPLTLKPYLYDTSACVDMVSSDGVEPVPTASNVGFRVQKDTLNVYGSSVNPIAVYLSGDKW